MNYGETSEGLLIVESQRQRFGAIEEHDNLVKADPHGIRCRRITHGRMAGACRGDPDLGQIVGQPNGDGSPNRRVIGFRRRDASLCNR